MYGVLEVKLPSGKKVYFKRHVWGLHGEELVLSSKPVLEPFYDSASDWTFTCEDKTVYYKIEKETLIIIPYCGEDPPELDTFPIEIKLIKYELLDWLKFEDTAIAQGFKLVDVPVE